MPAYIEFTALSCHMMPLHFSPWLRASIFQLGNTEPFFLTVDKNQFPFSEEQRRMKGLGYSCPGYVHMTDLWKQASSIAISGMTYLQQKDTIIAHNGYYEDTHAKIIIKKGSGWNCTYWWLPGRMHAQIRAETYVSYLVSGLEFHIGPLLLTTELYPGLEADASIISSKKTS